MSPENAIQDKIDAYDSAFNAAIDRAEKAEAQCATMREALQSLDQSYRKAQSDDVQDKIDGALTGIAGQHLLDQLTRYREVARLARELCVSCKYDSVARGLALDLLSALDKAEEK